MFPTLISIGRFVYYVSAYVYENKTIILTAYSLFDTKKFSVYTLYKLGILDLIKKKITTSKSETIILELLGVESSKVGDFEIISID